ncbi:jg26623, partial [Pararge aegeria aegeria]
FSAAEFLRPYDAINNNKKDLMNIIKSLKSFNENWNINKKVSKKVITNDVKEELSDVEKEKKLQELLWLLKKNYDAQEQYNLIHNPVHSGARVYFIRNPDAIDEYKKHLEQKKT